MLFFPHRKINDYSRDLFRAVEPLGKKYFVYSTMGLNTDPGFLDLADPRRREEFLLHDECRAGLHPRASRAASPRAANAHGPRPEAWKIAASGFLVPCGIGRDWDEPGRGGPGAGVVCRGRASTRRNFSFSRRFPARRIGTAWNGRTASSTSNGRTTTAPMLSRAP